MKQMLHHVTRPGYLSRSSGLEKQNPLQSLREAQKEPQHSQVQCSLSSW